MNKNEEDTEENQDGIGEKENLNKSQFLLFKNFKFFLKVLKDYYFLCMVKRSYEKKEFIHITYVDFWKSWTGWGIWDNKKTVL